MRFDYRNPVDLRFGWDRIGEAGEVARTCGDRALLVTGRHSMQRHGFLDELRESLNAAAVEHFSFEEVGPNPLTGTVDRCADLARDEGCDLVIGLGGGSAMDAAKAIAVAAVEGPPFWRFAPGGGGDLEAADALPVICIPSTSGTGSEVDQYTIISNGDTGEKLGLGSDALFPAASIVDPALPSTMPPRLTAVTGVDVLIHALEAHVSQKANPVSDALCVESMRLLGRNLEDTYSDPSRESRTGMATASTLAGMAISSAGTGLVHALEHPVSGRHRDVAHAEGLAALALPVVEFNLGAAEERYSSAAHLLSGGDSRDVTGVLRDVLHSLDMPTSLEELGVSRDEFRGIARDALRTMGDAVEHNPRRADEEELVELLEASAD
ncbi:MAG: hypothetical protein MAG715_00877 [Methanonatronarchaeales archaeon]|nr:hypothetical protein [Methanonatronarchaeales archaeon]